MASDPTFLGVPLFESIFDFDNEWFRYSDERSLGPDVRFQKSDVRFKQY